MNVRLKGTQPENETLQKLNMDSKKELQELIKLVTDVKEVSLAQATIFLEENPQNIWKSGRSHMTHNTFILNIEKATNDFVAYLKSSSFSYKLLHLTVLS